MSLDHVREVFTRRLGDPLELRAEDAAAAVMRSGMCGGSTASTCNSSARPICCACRWSVTARELQALFEAAYFRRFRVELDDIRANLVNANRMSN